MRICEATLRGSTPGSINNLPATDAQIPRFPPSTVPYTIVGNCKSSNPLTRHGSFGIIVPSQLTSLTLKPRSKMKSFVAVLRLECLLLVYPFFVAVLRVLCAFVVKIRPPSPSFIAHPSLVGPLHRSRVICSEVNHFMLQPCAPEHQCRVPMWGIFSPPRLPRLCWPLSEHDMHIFDVNKWVVSLNCVVSSILTESKSTEGGKDA
jgi:hypothetical protein